MIHFNDPAYKWGMCRRLLRHKCRESESEPYLPGEVTDHRQRRHQGRPRKKTTMVRERWRQIIIQKGSNLCVFI
jgi:hypothetical protein